MSTHARVIEVIPVWVTQQSRPVLRLELANGKRTDLPCGLDAKVGDVVMLATEQEFRLIETYRENTKGKRA